jgi:hypothetical protein
MTDTEAAYEASVRRTFARRWMAVAAVALVYVAANLIRAEAPLGRLLPPEWAGLSGIWMWLTPVWGAALIWAARCPACGGWIRLDGRTCGACKRDLRTQATRA